MNLSKKYNWISLQDENLELMESILSNWESLLNQELQERYYHEFLKQHAGFFFSDQNCYVTISKLKLGSELETDFVNIRDQRSNGLIYEFIEIEKPQSRLFNKSGLIAQDFNSSIQQIRDWKRFLIDNKSWFRKYLPTRSTRVINDSFIKFIIIIGRRGINDSEIEKRNQIANEVGIEIRSFDYLTDLLKMRKFFNTACLDSGKGEVVENQIENPFYKAISDSKWRQFCTKKLNTTHFYQNYCADIVKLRDYNSLIEKMC